VTDAQSKLENMTLPERIAAIAADRDSERDEYREIAPHELALLLDIGDADRPGRDWKFERFVQHVPVEDIVESWDLEYAIDLLKPHVTTTRYGELTELLDIATLTNDEKHIVEQLYMESESKNSCYHAVAHYTIKVPNGDDLIFEASIEDDGGCIDLMTPYDERDGKFVHISNNDLIVM
jgi:hypothetical protein